MEQYIKGYISGMVATVFSHPFDTLKTNIQEGKRITFNPLTLYRGVSAPLMGIGLEKAVVFGTQHQISRMCDERQIGGYKKIGISGAIAGMLASFVVTPFERIKILL